MKPNQLDKAIAALEVEQAAISRAIDLLKLQRTAQGSLSRTPVLVKGSAS